MKTNILFEFNDIKVEDRTYNFSVRAENEAIAKNKIIEDLETIIEQLEQAV